MGLRLVAVCCLLAAVARAQSDESQLQSVSSSVEPQPLSRPLTAQEIKNILPVQKFKVDPKYRYTPNAGKVKLVMSSAAKKAAAASGTLSYRGEWPWNVAIIADSAYFFGGSLVAPLWVITAAQCLQGRTNIKLRMGAYQRNGFEDGRVNFDGATWELHPEFNSTSLQNDIAMIKLSMPVTATNYINFIRLPTSNEMNMNLTRRAAFISGYKRTDSNGVSVLGQTLTSASRTVMSNAECATAYGLSWITNTSICTSGVNKETCPGDLGSPLAYKEGDGKYTLIGVLSFESSNCSATLPSGHSRVTAYMQWITGHIASTTPKPAVMG